MVAHTPCELVSKSFCDTHTINQVNLNSAKSSNDCRQIQFTVDIFESNKRALKNNKKPSLFIT